MGAESQSETYSTRGGVILNISISLLMARKGKRKYINLNKRKGLLLEMRI
jgi:hypothetical protein